MNFDIAEKQAYKKAESDAAKVASDMLKQYDQAQKEIIAEIEKVYGKYLISADPADYYNIMIQFDRLNKLLQQCQDVYNVYYKQIAKEIEACSSIGISNNYYYNQYAFAYYVPKELGLSLSFTMLDPRIVELSVTNSPKVWKDIYKNIVKQYELNPNLITSNAGTLSKIIYDNKVEDLKKIQQTITQGFIQGKSAAETSKGIRETIDTAKYKSDRIARTEFTRTSSTGQYLNSIDVINQGVKIKRQWVASLDNRTRHNHAALDGKVVEVGQPFTIGGDSALFPGGFSQAKNSINCRCRVIDIIEGSEPQARVGRNPDTGQNETFSYKNFDQWAKENNLKRNKYGELLPK